MYENRYLMRWNKNGIQVLNWGNQCNYSVNIQRR
jgi:hypothetical protein